MPITNVISGISKNLFDANTILKADSDNTPLALSVAASQIVARAAAGGIDALTVAQMKTLLAYLHGDLGSVTADQHHAQAHTLTSHSTRAHSELTSIGASDHHVKTTSFADITDRAGVTKLNWTLNKLLKGAGAGVNPTEIDVPAGVSTKLISFTRQMNAVSGAVAYTGVGFQPKAVIIVGTGDYGGSTGFADSSGAEGGIFATWSGALPVWGSAALIVRLEEGTTLGAQGQDAVLTSLNADGFTLTWTKNGTPSSAVKTLYALCLG